MLPLPSAVDRQVQGLQLIGSAHLANQTKCQAKGHQPVSKTGPTAAQAGRRDGGQVIWFQAGNRDHATDRILMLIAIIRANFVQVFLANHGISCCTDSRRLGAHW